MISDFTPEFYAQQGALQRQLRLYGDEAVGLPAQPQQPITPAAESAEKGPQ